MDSLPERNIMGCPYITYLRDRGSLPDIEAVQFILNDVIIFGRYPQFSIQTTYVLRVYNGWSEVKPAENDDVIYEQPLITILHGGGVIPINLLQYYIGGRGL